MPTRTIDTDYLVVGCGAAGMAFVDALLADSDADVVMIDRRHAPGGHWHDAYPFVRLHQPSAYYGANSLPLGSDTIDRAGSNEGFYERAGAAEICAYYDRVMQQVLLPSGRVRYFPMCEYVGAQRFVSRLSGDRYEVRVRRKRVDATYLEPAIPATCKPPFEVASGARCVPVHELARQAQAADGYTIIGAGKTAIDACLWLLDTGVAPEAIRWIKPSESWLMNRVFAQGGERVATMFEGISLQVQAAAEATSIDDLFARLNATDQLLRVDEAIAPTAYRGATVSARELRQLRSIRDVVRLGHVRRIEPDAIMLERGTIATGPHVLHVHCAARGLNPAPAVPMFGADTITLQPVRTGLIPFNAALVGFVEATHEDTAVKNRLCPPNRLPHTASDWARGTLIGLDADYRWSRDAAISGWLERARLNPTRGLRQRMGEPGVRNAMKRYTDNVRPARERLQQFASVTD
jgi:hypothetical protein